LTLSQTSPSCDWETFSTCRRSPTHSRSTARTPENEWAFRRATAATGHRKGTPQKPKILIFDEAVSNLDSHTAEHFARTINKLKVSVTMLFITHQVPRGLQVDEVVKLGSIVRQMEVVEEGKMG
jgi:hypothetical protein